MKIGKIQAYEIFDSRGYPTVECRLILENGFWVKSSVPSGLSKGKHEAYELRDRGRRLLGMGVCKAVESIENIISPALIGKHPDVVALDKLMLCLDDTPDKHKLGSNAMLAVSIAVLRAQAALAKMELYEFIAQLCGKESVMLPFPWFNMIGGGMHADTNVHIQEFMVIPSGAQNFRESMEYGFEFFHALKTLLKKRKKNVAVGDEGAFVPLLENDIEALDYLAETITQLQAPDKFKLAIDVAASHFYDEKNKVYNWLGKQFDTKSLIAMYSKWINDYPICTIEDGLAADDIEGWEMLTAKLGQKIGIIGDDIFATDPNRIYHGILGCLATGTVIKPNQIGTVTETLQAIQVCQEYGFLSLVAHRSGETNDSFIADLVVGASAGQIKAGGFSRGERLAKYNRLLTIEDELALSLLDD